MGDYTSSISRDLQFDGLESLVVRLKEGDERAFAEVFELYKDLVYGLCCRLLNDKGEALDVTQEVFLTLYRKIHQFRGQCTLKTWLYRVALNQAANRNRWWRRRHRNRTTSLSLIAEDGSPSELELPSPEPSPHRSLVSRELRDAINEGLSRLPFEQRTAIVLREIQGLSYEEISQITGAHVGTVKSRIARGRERLRKGLSVFRPGEPK